MATARPATVVTSASATPGATAVMFPAPLVAMPMNASMTPSTVPSNPISGLTEPNVASHGTYFPSRSCSASTCESSTIRRASSCVGVSASTTPGPRRSPPGRSSWKKAMPSWKSRW
jgi:hypothetical protein